jgi:hypothetical protein
MFCRGRACLPPLVSHIMASVPKRGIGRLVTSLNSPQMGHYVQIFLPYHHIIHIFLKTKHTQYHLKISTI